MISSSSGQLPIVTTNRTVFTSSNVVTQQGSSLLQGSSLEQELTRLRQNLEETVKMLGLSAIETERLNRELTLERGKASNSSELMALRSQNASLSGQIAALTIASQQDRATIERLNHIQIENSQLKSEVHILKTSVVQTSSGPNLDDLKNDITLLAGENERLQSQVQNLKSTSGESSSMRIKISSIEAELQRCKTSLDDLRRLESNLRGELQGKSMMLESVRVQLSQRESTIAEMNLRLANSSSSSDMLSRLRVEFEGIKSENSRLLLEVSRLNQLVRSNSDQANELSVLRSKNSQLELELRSTRENSLRFQSSVTVLQEQLTLAQNNPKIIVQKDESLANQLKSHISMLESEVGGLKNDNSRLQSGLRAEEQYKSEISRLQQEVYRITQDYQQLQNSSSQTETGLNSRILQLTNEMNSVKTEIQNLSQENASLRGAPQEIQKLKERMTSQRSEIQTLSAELETLRLAPQEITRLNGLANQLQQEMQEISSENNRLKGAAQEVDRLNNNLSQVQGDFSRLLKEHQDLVAKTANEQQRYENQIQSQSHIVQSLQNENSNLNNRASQIPQMEQKINELMGQILHLTQENLYSGQNSAAKMQELMGQIMILTTNFDAATKESRELKAGVEGQRNENQKYRTELERLREESLAFETQSYKQINELQAEVRRLLALNDDLNKRLLDGSSSADSKTRELVDQIMQLNVRIMELENENRQLRGESGDQVRQLSEERTRLSRQVDDLRNSTEFEVRGLRDQADKFKGEVERLTHLLAEQTNMKSDITGRYTSDVERVTMEMTRVSTEHDALRQQHLRMQEEFMNRIKDMNQEIDTLRQQNQALLASSGAEGQSAQQTISNMRNEIQGLTQRLNDLNNENQHLKDGASNSRVEFDRLTLEIQRLNSHSGLATSELENTVRLLRSENEDLKRRHSELHEEHLVTITEVTTLKSRSHAQVSQEPIRQYNGSSDEKWKMLLVENERLQSKISDLEFEVTQLRKVRAQYSELTEDLGILRTALHRAEQIEAGKDLEIAQLKEILNQLGDEIKLKCRIIDEKTFMLVDLEKRLERELNDTTEVHSFYKKLDQHKTVIKSLEDDNDRLRLEASKLKEEFLFKNQVEDSLSMLRKTLDDEKDLSSTKDTKIKHLEDKLGKASGTLTGLPLLEQNNQSLKDEVFKMQNMHQEKDLLLYKMREVASDMQKDIDRIPELKLILENGRAERERMKYLLDQKDNILQEYAGKLDILKEGLGEIVILEEKIKYLEEENIRLNRALNDKTGQVHVYGQSISDLQRANQVVPDLQHEARFLRDELERAKKNIVEKETLLHNERDRFNKYITDLQRQSGDHLLHIAELEKLLREAKIKEQAIVNEHGQQTNLMHNKIRELVLAITHLKDDNNRFEETIKDLQERAKITEHDLLELIAVKKERDTARSELEKSKNDNRMITGVLGNAEERITRLEGGLTRLKLSENENSHLKEENRGLENRLRDMILQREKINNEVTMTIDKGRAGVYSMQTQIDELKAQVKQMTDMIIFKDREIAILKAQSDDLMAKLKLSDLRGHEALAKLDALDVEFKEIELFRQGPGVYGKAYGYINYEKEFNIVKLLHDQLAMELQNRNKAFQELKVEYDRLAKRLPEFEEMKVELEGTKLHSHDAMKDNQSKAQYISTIQMKLVIAMAELERLRKAGQPWNISQQGPQQGSQPGMQSANQSGHQQQYERTSTTVITTTRN